MRIKNTTRQERDFIAWFVSNSKTFIDKPFTTLWNDYEKWCETSGHTNRGVEWVVNVLTDIGIGGTADSLAVLTKPCPTCKRPGYSIFNPIEPQ